MQKKIFNQKQTQGFTLVELMVSLTIFSTVMLVSTGTLLILIDVNAKAQAVYSSTTNLTFALDNITREIRTGYHYACPTTQVSQLSSSPNDCEDGDTSISFRSERQGGDRIGFRLNATTNAIEQSEGGGVWIPLTSEDVFVETFEFTVSGSEPYLPNGNDVAQPTVDLFISGYVNNGLDSQTEFSIQSHVVQRRLDII